LEGWSPEIKEFVEQLLTKDKEKRPRAQNALAVHKTF
jgi:hypothetical protein